MFNSKSALTRRLQFLAKYYFFYAVIFVNIVAQDFRVRFSRLFPLRQAAEKSTRSKVIKFIWFFPLVAYVLFRAAFGKISRSMTQISSVALFVHKKISGRALNAFVNKYPKRKDSILILEELKHQISSGSTDSTVLVMAISLAVKLSELDVARGYADMLLLCNPEAFNDHQQAGVWFFIGGYYEDAEKIWGQSAECRELAIATEGLDKLKLRFMGPSWLLAIGHIAHLDSYFKQKILSGNNSQRTIILRPRLLQIPNQALLNCWHQYAEIFPSNIGTEFTFRQIEFLQDEFWSIRLKPNDTRMFSHAGAVVQRKWDQKGYGPLLKLSSDQEAAGWSQIERLGLPKGHWFVCLHVREAGFHKAWHEKHPGTRNANVLTYMKAVQKIVDCGGYVVRVGDPTMTKLPMQKGVIDYAHSDEKSEELDIFLCAKARFFIGTNSGLGLVPPIFGVPCALTNWTPIALPQWYGRDRFIPKSIYSKKWDRTLSLTEIFTSPVAWQQFQSYFDSAGLEVLDNTPEEIEELTLELLEETAGRDVLTNDDRKLLQAYNQLAEQNRSYVGARLGRAHLRRHADELSRLVP